MLTDCSPIRRVFPELACFAGGAGRTTALRRAYRDARGASRFRIWEVLALALLAATLAFRGRLTDQAALLAVVYGVFGRFEVIAMVDALVTEFEQTRTVRAVHDPAGR